ncbi:MAG TPA: hypothetical protein ENN29_09205 [Candidatus Hydrogenedentes bacterium]|nr:hypothetical protein [Candidatus Hydrogenedentota bacterium]
MGNRINTKLHTFKTRAGLHAVLLFALAGTAWGGDAIFSGHDALCAPLQVSGAAAAPDMRREARKRWFVLVGMINVYPRLEREQMIKDILDPAVRTLAPGYRGTRTFTEMRDERLLWTPQIALGRVLSERFALSVHGGYSEGPVHTKKRNASIFFGAPLYSNVRIRRYATYVGLDLDYYPLGMVEQKDYANWRARLRGVKPTLGARHTWTWAGFDAKIRIGVWPFKEIVKVKLDDKWTLPNITLVAGVDVPLNKRSAVILNVGYSFFWKEKKDFAGPAFTLGWRYMF